MKLKMSKIVRIVIITILVFLIIPLNDVQATDNHEENDVCENQTSLQLTNMGNYQVIEDNFTSTNEVKTYNISIDFNDIDSAAVCFIRTGKTDATMTVTDEAGNVLTTMGTSKSNARRWYVLNKPFLDSGICNYTVTLTSYNYDENISSYRLTVGDEADIEEMISGIDNTVYLDKYTEKSGNAFFTYYTPNRFKSWYRFTALDETTVFTLLTYYPETRFQVFELQNTNIPIYDSAKDSEAHRTKYCTSSYKNAEKAKLKLQMGKEYYLAVYASSQISSQPLVTKTMNISVGKPSMLGESGTFYATSLVTGKKNSYSPSVIIPVDSTIPKTAVADYVLLQSGTAGVKLSDISNWSVKLPSENSWRNANKNASTITIGYVPDATNNVNINGNWQFRFEPSGSSLTFIPGIYIHYYYEIGD